MLKRFIFSVMFVWGGCFHANAVIEWENIKSPVSSGPEVVEFFSFYCPPCYKFSQIMGVDEEIRRVLSKDERMEKYHVSQLGLLGHDLTRTWALAKVCDS